MTAPKPQSFRHDLPLLAVLGISNPAEGDWDRYRAIQYTALGKQNMLVAIANIALALLVSQLFRGVVPLSWLAGWLVALVAALTLPIIVYRRSGMEGHSHIARRHGAAMVGATGLVALLWSVPMFLFVPIAGPAGLAPMVAAVAALVVGSTLLLNALPLGALVFNLVLMAATAVQFWLMGFAAAVVTVIALSLMLILSGVMNARAFLLSQISEAGLAEKEEVVSLLLREFEETDADWLWQIDSTRRIVDPHPRFAFAAGHDAADMTGLPLVQLMAGPAWESGRFPSSLHELAERLKKREAFSNLVVQASIKGRTRWWELSASPRFDSQGAFIGFRGVGSDVTESRENAEKIARMARFDPLTGLPNRLQVTEALDRALAQCQQWNSRCAFLMIDLDRFKSVNDTLGHLVGDRLLAQVSMRLKSLMSKAEMCGRLGGDEFAVVMHQVSNPNEVTELAERIIEVLSRPYDVDQHTLYIGASIGSAIGPRDGDTVETLMRNADLALYRSKDEGGDKHHSYEPRLHMHAEERRVMEIALRKALERDEFSLSYQPVVCAETETVVGFEALLRWYNPEFGQVSPAKFIPLAEEARLVVPIGNWVLHRACKEAMLWPPSVKVAVNVSAEQLYEPDFVETVIEALSESGLPAQRLELEVTESVFLREGSRASATLDRILALGIGLSLDDFGTGYSALGYLSKTRFTTIKVDRSFVQGAAKQLPESLAIIRAVVAMAQSLGISTTAEGAETRHEVDVIRNLGCNKIQGYYYGRPIPADEVLALFSDYRQAQFG